MNRYRKAVAAVLVPVLAIPTLGAWIAGTEPFDVGVLVTALASGLVTALSVWRVPNEPMPGGTEDF